MVFCPTFGIAFPSTEIRHRDWAIGNIRLDNSLVDHTEAFLYIFCPPLFFNVFKLFHQTNPFFFTVLGSSFLLPMAQMEM